MRGRMARMTPNPALSASSVRRMPAIRSNSSQAMVLTILASTIASTTGAFSFANVSLVAGENPLSAVAFNSEGTTSSYSLTVNRQQATATNGGAVLEWNQIMLDAIRSDSSTPPIASRGMAMESLAVLDAINAINGTAGYLVNMTAPAGASADAAVAAAAHKVLTYLYPGADGLARRAVCGRACRDRRRAGQDRRHRAGRSRRQPDHRAARQRRLEHVRRHTTAAPMWASGGRPRRCTTSALTAAVGRPRAVRDDQPRSVPAGWSAGPDQPGLGRRRQRDQVARRARQHDAHRRPDADRPLLGRRRRHLHAAGALEPDRRAGRAAAGPAAWTKTARLFAELNVALADAAIVAWDAKYTYDAWRPITAIQNADEIGNPGITQDTGLAAAHPRSRTSPNTSPATAPSARRRPRC